MTTYPDRLALVVDDDHLTRSLLRMLLAELELPIMEATNGADAMFLAMARSFDLVLMDMLMPRVNGLDAIRAIRTVDLETPIIVVTACNDPQLESNCRSLNIQQYLRKPIEPAQLHAAVHAALHNRTAV